MRDFQQGISQSLYIFVYGITLAITLFRSKPMLRGTDDTMHNIPSFMLIVENFLQNNVSFA